MIASLRHYVVLHYPSVFHHSRSQPSAMAAHASTSFPGLTQKRDIAAFAVDRQRCRDARVSHRGVVAVRRPSTFVTWCATTHNNTSRRTSSWREGADEAVTLQTPRAATKLMTMPPPPPPPLPTTTMISRVSTRNRKRTIARCSAGDSVVVEETPCSSSASTSSSVSPADSRKIVFLCAVTMLLASADRTIFSLASMAIAKDLSLGMSTLGLLQSAFFWGYGVTQVLGGVTADRLGGARVLLVGLGVWSLAVMAVPVASTLSTPVTMLVVARILFGAASGCAIPASAAAVATCVVSERRASSLSFIFTFFNCGSAFGLLLAGGLISTLGWQSVFLAFGGLGVAWSIFGYTALPAAARGVGRVVTTESGKESAAEGEEEEEMKKKKKKKDDEGGAAAGSLMNWLKLPRWMYPQLAALAWCHVCINWGFFILQSWLPVYLSKELGFSLGSSGAVSAVPWFLTALMAFSSGQVADSLLTKGWERWKVRRLMMNVATVGPCLALLILPVAKSTPAALGLLAAMLGTQAVSIAGYHSYLQDVAPSAAGAFLGITNTLGVVAGIVANLLTGYIVESTGGFSYVFLVTAGVYASSGVVWNCFMRGRMLFA